MVTSDIQRNLVVVQKRNKPTLTPPLTPPPHSLMSGLSSMESKACCRMGVLTVTYYLWTTFIAVVVGIVLVIIIKPGVGTEMESNRLGGGPVMTSADALLDLIR